MTWFDHSIEDSLWYQNDPYTVHKILNVHPQYGLRCIGLFTIG